MKKLISTVLITLLTLFQFNLFSQSNNLNTVIKVIYKTSTYKFDEKSESVNLEKRKIIFDAYDSFEFELIYNENRSQFNIIDKIENENINPEYIIAKMIVGGLCFKDNITKEKITQIDNYYEVYNVIKPFDEYKWEITNENKIINGYKCYKAICAYQEYDSIRKQMNKYNPFVWFTPEIPTTFGPAGLDGLPGLVLEATFNNRLYYYATNINFDYKEKVKIEKPNKGKYITQEELMNINAELFKKTNE